MKGNSLQMLLTYLKKFLRRFRTLKPTPTSPLTRRGFHIIRGFIFIKKKLTLLEDIILIGIYIQTPIIEKYKDGC